MRASSRGMRASIGPRAARVHVGAGRTRISSGAGPVTVSTAVGGGQRRGTARSPGSSGRTARSPGPRQPTVAQLRAQARAAQRAQQVADVAASERSLTTLHYAEFPESSRQVLPVPPRPDPATVESVRRELYQGATAGVSVWKRTLRKQAKTWAGQQASSEAERRYTGGVVAAQLEQWHLDQQWQALLAHDPNTVIPAVDEAFADNASDSTCVDAGTDPETGARYVTAVVGYGGIDLVPEHRPDTTPGGKPTLRKRTKTNRNDLYATAVASTVLATAKEALAVAVAATEARVLVVRPHRSVGVEPVYAGTLRRELLAQREWRRLDPLDVVMSTENAELARKGSTREVVTWPVDADSPAQDILNAWSRTYDSEPETEPPESADD
ncbi:MAG: hypothetical protein ABI692_16890 [Terracoccus sp.]